MIKMRVLFALLLTTVIATAQEPVEEYNKNGDAAINSQQYDDAKIYYSIGADKCNEHSIRQLTKIWLADESMRPSMLYVMRKCYDCLNNHAIRKRDSTAMKMLIQYYAEGIGTEINEDAANMWKSQLQKIRNPQAEGEASNKGKAKTHLFVGYSASLLAPYGLTVGVVGKTVGGYLRFRTNLGNIPQHGGQTCYLDGDKIKLDGLDGDYAYQYSGATSANVWMGTGGIVICASQAFHISAGGGYGQRETFCQFDLIDKTVTQNVKNVWAKRTDTSESGVVVDLDATFRLGKTLYGSVGCSAFNFKYVYANAGIGVFF